MPLYPTNTQFNTRFWVDMRYGVAYINELATSQGIKFINLIIIYIHISKTFEGSDFYIIFAV
jgi:hypothetical protein